MSETTEKVCPCGCGLSYEEAINEVLGTWGGLEELFGVGPGWGRDEAEALLAGLEEVEK